MTICTPMSTCSNNVRCFIGNVRKQTPRGFCNAFSQSQYRSYTLNKNRMLSHSSLNIPRANLCSMTFKSVVNPRFHRRACFNVRAGHQDLNLRLLVPKKRQSSKVECKVGPFTWRRHGASVGLCVGMLVCFSSSTPSYAEAREGNEKKGSFSVDASSPSFSQEKKVLNDYSVIGIPGDGRCLFRSVAHGACIRSGKPAPDENLQRQLADELRAMVADELVRRREETEWFIEGDFDTYITQIRKPHVWGGEPELLMASHVLQMPITVYMADRESGGLISIAEYGQEYGKDNPIKVLYHGYGHYDALHVPPRPRL